MEEKTKEMANSFAFFNLQFNLEQKACQEGCFRVIS